MTNNKILFVTLTVLLLITVVCHLSGFEQHNQSSAARTSENERLLHSLQSDLDEGDEAIRKITASIQAGFTTEAMDHTLPEASKVKAMLKMAGALKGGKEALNEVDQREYLNTLYVLIKESAEYFGGVAGPTAFTTDLGLKLAELSIITRDQERLYEAAWNLAQANQYAKFKDPRNQAELKRILNALHGESSVWDATFKSQLAQYQQAREALAAVPLKESNPVIAKKLTRGLQIVDPDSNVNALARDPTINPDFITALQAQNFIARQAQSDPRWLKFSVTHYPDGRFIPAYGPCLGIDIPNPFTGGLISSSVAACGKDPARRLRIALSPGGNAPATTQSRLEDNSVGRITPQGTINNSAPNNEQLQIPNQSVRFLVGDWQAQLPGNEYVMRISWNRNANRFEGYLTRQGELSAAVGFSIGELCWTAKFAGQTDTLMEEQELRSGSNGVTTNVFWTTGTVYLKQSSRNQLVTSTARFVRVR